MSDYLLEHGTRKSAQSEPISPDQVENSAGGYVWAVDPWTQLRRFLILGSEGGAYYATERDLTRENVAIVRACITADGLRTVGEIVAVSQGGNAPKNDPALYALAACISLGDRATKSAAAEALPQVARIGTHLYHFVAFAETMRGWGRTMRWAVQNWYNRNPDQLELQLVKYRQRDGWSHRDLLRLAHPTAESAENALLFAWVTGKLGADSARPPLIEGFEKAQVAATAADTARLVREYGLPREALNSDHLNNSEVWRAMLEGGMPITALTRNLATMTRNGVLDDRQYQQIACATLTDPEAVKKSRIHPLTLLVALRTYSGGRSYRGTGQWLPKPDVVDAIDEAFYLAFDNVEPTGKAHLLAVDVSGSMDGGEVCSSPLTPREAAAAMALVTLHAEADCEIVAFSAAPNAVWRKPPGRSRAFHQLEDGLTPVGISRRQRLDDAVRVFSDLPMGGTDCAIPMEYAAEAQRKIDAFAIYTDNETWVGAIHPKQALDRYRNLSGIPARCIVVGMVANRFTIADPNDPGMMDVVGFDTSAPALMADFAAGRL